MPPGRTVARAARVTAVVAVVAALLVSGTAPAPAGTRPQVALEPLASVNRATAMAVRDGDAAIYVSTQPGLVQRIVAGSEPQTVLDVTALVVARGEQGLLGLAFAPDGDHLYVHYSGVAAGETVVEEYAMEGDLADPTTRRVLLVVPQPQVNHNGGELSFGPDGYLYLGLGDGGSQGDVGRGHAAGGNGQSLDTLLGKILRLDPQPSGSVGYTVPTDNPLVATDGRPEIFVSGLRNPWRFSWDRKNGDLWIADVGQNEIEEVTRLRAADAPGANLGWNLYEGTEPFREGEAVDVVMPQIQATHDDGNCSITGGYVYRGRAIRSLRGWYLFSDYCNGAIKAVKVRDVNTAAASGELAAAQDLGIELSQISSFGQDAKGELYVLSQDRGIFKVVRAQ